MIASVYAAFAVCSVLEGATTPLGWRVLGCLALVIAAYLLCAAAEHEWRLRCARR